MFTEMHWKVWLALASMVVCLLFFATHSFAHSHHHAHANMHVVYSCRANPSMFWCYQGGNRPN